MKYYVTITLAFICITITAMENNITYHQATPDHTQRIVDVINNYAIADNTKIVIFPKKFRTVKVEQDIEQHRLYCALNEAQEVIAFKKLFIVHDQEEFNIKMNREMRATTEPYKIELYDEHNGAQSISADNFPQISFENSVIIYLGGDYTIPMCRDQKINSTLTRYAFNAIKNDVIKTIQEKNPEYIVLLYGLATINAGENGGIDRTPAIVRAFKEFATHIMYECAKIPNNSVFHSQYKAFMPVFDPESDTCGPLLDEQSLPKYGNILVFPFNTELQ